MKSQLKKTIYVLTSTLLFLNSSASHTESLASTPFWEYQAGWSPPAPAGFNNSIENSPTADIAAILERIRVYILKFGLYLGFDLESDQPPNAYNALINTTDTILIESSIVKNSFSILASNLLYPLLVPQDNTYKELNSILGTVFSLVTPVDGLDVPSSQNNSGSGQNQTLSPVSQLVLNILSYTPEGYCIGGSTGSTIWNSNCLYQYTPAFIMGKALGVPMSNDALTHGGLLGSSYYNALAETLTSGNAINLPNWYPLGSSSGQASVNPQQNLLNQIDSSVFLTPLIYSKSNNNQQDPNANCQQGAPCGLAAQNQIQAAQDFLRYLTGAVLPPTLPTKDLFDSIMKKISRATDTQQQISSFDSLTSYLLGVRVYAARQSVAIQNIYEMLSKRIPQDSRDKTFSGSSTSQAMDEFIMATYRLFTPNTQASSQGAPSGSAWQTKISGASSTTVEKEMVMLLAEINYQLYQMRQQQERMLLTESLIMLNANNYPLLQDNS